MDDKIEQIIKTIEAQFSEGEVLSCYFAVVLKNQGSTRMQRFCIGMEHPAAEIIKKDIEASIANPTEGAVH